MKFGGICIITENVPTLVRFYSQVLGLTAEGNDIHSDFDLNGPHLSIFTTTGMEEMAPGSMRKAGYGSVTLTFEVADVDAEYERLKALNVEFVKPPQTHPWGARAFWFRDPDGNIVDFYMRC